MKCPVCDTQLSDTTLEDVEADICKNCKGIFLARERFTSYIAKLSVKPETPYAELKLDRDAKDTFQIKKDVRNIYKVNEIVKTCPSCNLGMEKSNYAYDSNIIIDKCSNCNSVWLDAGEAIKLAQHRKGNPLYDALGKAYLQHDEEMKKWSKEAMEVKVSRAFFLMPRFIIPLSDSIPTHNPPLVTMSLIGINIVVFFTTLLAGLEKTITNFGAYPDELFGVGIITSMFLHADIWHLVGNMLFLWIFGDNVEEYLGRKRFILFYLLGGIVADIIFALCVSAGHIPMVGASGAISAVMGAYFILYPQAMIRLYLWGIIVPIPAVLYLISWFGLQILYAAFSGSNSIAWFAHIGGFLFGIIWAAYEKYICHHKSSD